MKKELRVGGMVFLMFFSAIAASMPTLWADDEAMPKAGPQAAVSGKRGGNPTTQPATTMTDSKMAPVVGMTRKLSAGNLRETTVRVESMKRLAEALKRMSEQKQKAK